MAAAFLARVGAVRPARRQRSAAQNVVAFCVGRKMRWTCYITSDAYQRRLSHAKDASERELMVVENRRAKSLGLNSVGGQTRAADHTRISPPNIARHKKSRAENSPAFPKWLLNPGSGQKPSPVNRF